MTIAGHLGNDLNGGYGGDMRNHTDFLITRVRSADDLAATVQLFKGYAASLDVDLAYQDFAAEIEAMPGRYAPPSGALLLARGGAAIPVGCIGVRPMELAGCCEMKRLFVVPQARGTGIGRRLVQAAVAVAEAIGYREMRLDTLPSMAGAQALYRKLGFAVIEPYYNTPVVGTLFMRRILTPPSMRPR
jgi:ribosomal protein S18 acetylase RimI-like enzyme